VGNWGFARLFAECIDKIHYDPVFTKSSAEEQAFEQVISRFEQYLESVGKGQEHQSFGLIIHDNNETVSIKHTSLMKHFHKKGTLWTDVKNIIETPLFVDSELTSMVQIADLCSYALRRYLENNEDDLFKLIFVRAHRKHGAAVGVRHYSTNNCTCEICTSHKR
jgi:hypothetical protein